MEVTNEVLKLETETAGSAIVKTEVLVTNKRLMITEVDALSVVVDPIVFVLVIVT